MSEEKHTPLPWQRNIRPARKYPVVFSGWNTHVLSVAVNGLSDAEIEANMELIIRSVNAVPALIKALEEIGYIDDFLDADSAKRMLGIARDALAAHQKT